MSRELNKEEIEKVKSVIEKISEKPVVYLGRGGTFSTLRYSFFLGWQLYFFVGSNNFKIPRFIEPLNGTDHLSYYFAPLDSDIAKLNGHFPNPPETKTRIKL